MNSIIQQDKSCYVCGSRSNLELHHCIYGMGKRKLADKYGLTIYLCHKHHTGSDSAIHFNKPLDNLVKELAQTKAMNYYNWTIEDWMKIFRRNYV